MKKRKEDRKNKRNGRRLNDVGGGKKGREAGIRQTEDESLR